MSKFLQTNAEFVGEGCFFGKLFEVSWYPGAILSTDRQDLVFGQIFKLNNAEKTFKILDDYEGISETAEVPNEYTRVITNAFLSADVTIKTWVYVYNLPTSNLKQITSGNYLKN